jgi:hypothetical protein
MFALPAVGSAAPLEPPVEPPLPQLDFEPGSYDFGLQQVNSSDQATLHLRNDGEAAAPVYSLDISGPGAGVFQIDGGGTDCYGRNLQPGESCSVRVDFNPYDAVRFDAQLRVGSEQSTSFTASLSGEGGRSVLGPVVDPTNFGAVVVGSAGLTKAIDVTNSGNYPGGAFIAVIAGGAVGSFHLLDENCTGIRLSPGASCTLLVNFQPLSTGVKTARLGLFGEGDGGNQVTLTGIGVEAAVGSQVAPPVTSAPVTPRHKVRKGTKFGRHKSLRRHRSRRPLVRPAGSGRVSLDMTGRKL